MLEVVRLECFGREFVEPFGCRLHQLWPSPIKLVRCFSFETDVPRMQHAVVNKTERQNIGRRVAIRPTLLSGVAAKHDVMRVKSAHHGAAGILTSVQISFEHLELSLGEWDGDRGW